MNNSAMTGSSSRYRIQGVKGEYFDVFNKRASAIKAAIKMASEYPGTTFLVVKKSLIKEKVIFSFKIEADFQLDDIQDVYEGIVEVYQNKIDKIKYWRKSDDT